MNDNTNNQPTPEELVQLEKLKKVMDEFYQARGFDLKTITVQDKLKFWESIDGGAVYHHYGQSDSTGSQTQATLEEIEASVALNEMNYLTAMGIVKCQEIE